MLRWLLITVGAALCLLVGAAPYPAYVVELDRAPGDPRVGVPFEVGFSIHAADDAEPAAALAPLVVVTNAATREQIRVGARPAHAPGHYEALLVLPAPGRWQWDIYPEGGAGEAPVSMAPMMVVEAAEGWAPSWVSLMLVALFGAATVLGLAVSRLLHRRAVPEVEYARR